MLINITLTPFTVFSGTCAYIHHSLVGILCLHISNIFVKLGVLGNLVTIEGH